MRGTRHRPIWPFLAGPFPVGQPPAGPFATGPLPTRPLSRRMRHDPGAAPGVGATRRQAVWRSARGTRAGSPGLGAPSTPVRRARPVPRTPSRRSQWQAFQPEPRVLARQWWWCSLGCWGMGVAYLTVLPSAAGIEPRRIIDTCHRPAVKGRGDPSRFGSRCELSCRDNRLSQPHQTCAGDQLKPITERGSTPFRQTTCPQPRPMTIPGRRAADPPSARGRPPRWRGIGRWCRHPRARRSR